MSVLNRLELADGTSHAQKAIIMLDHIVTAVTVHHTREYSHATTEIQISNKHTHFYGGYRVE